MPHITSHHITARLNKAHKDHSLSGGEDLDEASWASDGSSSVASAGESHSRIESPTASTIISMDYSHFTILPFHHSTILPFCQQWPHYPPPTPACTYPPLTTQPSTSRRWRGADAPWRPSRPASPSRRSRCLISSPFSLATRHSIGRAREGAEAKARPRSEGELSAVS